MDPNRPFDGFILAQSYQDAVKQSWWKARPLYLDFSSDEDIPLL